MSGIPVEVVYDQDKVFISNENSGDLILTTQFKNYVRDRGFKVHMCRKADPESKAIPGVNHYQTFVCRKVRDPSAGTGGCLFKSNIILANPPISITTEIAIGESFEPICLGTQMLRTKMSRLKGSFYKFIGKLAKAEALIRTSCTNTEM